MAIYYIGKSQKDISNINVFSGSETIFGTNENENYAMFSLADEEKKELTCKQLQTAIESLRFGMEKFKLFDPNSTFVFSDKELMEKVTKVKSPDFLVKSSDIKLVENLNEFNKT